MKVEVTDAPALEVEASVLAAPVFEEDVASRAGLFGEIDRRLGGHLSRAAREEEFTGKPDSTLSLRSLGRIPASRVLLVGMGRRGGAGDRLARSGWEPLRMAAGRAARASAGAERLTIANPALEGGTQPLQAAIEGALLGAYRFERYKTSREHRGAARRALVVTVARGSERSREVRQAVDLAVRIAETTRWARDLINEPPLACTPTRLAGEARKLAREAGLDVEVRGPREIAALRMGLFLGVSRGSAEEPRLVRMSWLPRGAAAKLRPVVLVGKAITFDSGGLSLKPTESMVSMKTDMAGSAAVFAAMRIVAHLAPPFPVHALVGACENMPGGRAFKPSDILKSCNGKTVEVTNTDAEGRLVLGDVLAWAVARLRPAALVDIATLTGACVVALGQTTVGAFGPDGPVIDGVLAAARAAGEDVWRLPLTESIREGLDSDVADLKNTGERWGGAIAAAQFLREFVGQTPWAHLDIAGPCNSSKERGYLGKGGTGVGIRTLVEFVRGWSGRTGERRRGALPRETGSHSEHR